MQTKKLKQKYVASLCSILLISSASSATTTILHPNLNTGFNGALGLSQNVRVVEDNGELTFSWLPGNTANDILVFYFDTQAGGASDTSSFTDIADGGRRAISGFNGTDRSTLSFGGGFTANAALTMEPFFAGVFDQLGSNHNFIRSANITAHPDGYMATFNLSDIGVAQGDSFDVVATYISQTGFRSNEALLSANLITVNPNSNPGYSPVSFASFDTINTTAMLGVPEPSGILLFSSASLCGMLRRQRR